MADYASFPANATLDIRPFKAHVEEERLQHFKQLLELSPVAPPRYENTTVGRKYGIQRDWLQHAKQVWLHNFDWRKYEDRMNTYPNFKAAVKDGQGNPIDVQFFALFAEKPDAVPLVFIHGWPGSSCEFLDILDLLKQRYSPKTLPYHVIVPSLPGYAYSSGPPLETDYGIDVAAVAIHNLMVGLGFGSGYLTQGGDLGSFVSRILALGFDACKGMHVNMMGMPPPHDGALDAQQKAALDKATEAIDTGHAFALEQGTRPATVGMILSSSPIALLSWIGEKMLEWSEDDPPLEKILETVTLYWMTDTMSRCFYHSRALGGADESPKMARLSVVSKITALQLPYVQKPCGYSLFAHEIVPIPKSWAVQSCKLVSFSQHERGGHFAPMERPKELLDDVEEYVKKAWAPTD